MGGVDAAALKDFLADHAPFDSLDRYGLTTLAEAARLQEFTAGEVVVGACA